MTVSYLQQSPLQLGTGTVACLVSTRDKHTIILASVEALVKDEDGMIASLKERARKELSK